MVLLKNLTFVLSLLHYLKNNLNGIIENKHDEYFIGEQDICEICIMVDYCLF